MKICYVKKNFNRTSVKMIPLLQELKTQIPIIFDDIEV